MNYILMRHTRHILAILFIVALQVTTLLAQEEVVADEAVDGNTRGIMLLVLLLGMGIITLIGFYVSATEGQDQEEQG